MSKLKALLLSDIHVDVNSGLNENFYAEFELKLKSLPSIDVILLAGDVGHSIEAHEEAFRIINKTTTAKSLIYIPGNHDIWIGATYKSKTEKVKENSSWFKLNELLPQVCQKYGWHFLLGNPITLNEWGFAGTLGWYDYSTRNRKWDDKVSLAQYSTMVWEHIVHMDSVYALWNKSNVEMTDYFNQQLIKDCKQLKEMGITKDKIVILTHHVPFKQGIIYHDDDISMDFFSAFMGSINLGQIIIKNAKYAIFGHTHIRNDFFIEDLRALCYPMGYFDHEEAKSLPLEEFIQRGISIHQFE
ncbi:MAG: metallophosphoesterase [Promethearchaeota archaeon]